MFTERRKFLRATDLIRQTAEVDTALVTSKRLIAEIDVLLEHSHKLMNEQALLHRSWRW
jgi:hypothetical protein